MKLKRPQLVPNSSVARMLQTADQAWERRDFQQCFEQMERASRLDPANARILLILGQRYGLRYDYAAAERCFDKALRVAIRKTDALAAACRLSANFVNPKLPERYFQKALEQNNATPETFATVAEFYEGVRRVEEASKLLDRALQLDANCALARLTRARLNRNAGHLEEAEQILRPILATAEQQVRIRGYYELGAILDRQGRYDEAMAAFLEAKAILLREEPTVARPGAHASHPHEDVAGPTIRPKPCNAGLIWARNSNRSGAWRSWAAIRVRGQPCWNKCWIRIRTSSRPRKHRFLWTTCSTL